MKELDILVATVAAFVVAAILGRFTIPLLHRLKFGQSIREEGPSWHRKKSGTPTMGGIIFIIAVTIAVFLTSVKTQSLAVLCTALGFGLIGFADDYIKIAKKRNLGLTAKQKMAAQILVAAAFALFMMQAGKNALLHIPFTDIDIDLGYWFIPVSIFVTVGMVNSVNLTDGLDGLASFISTVVSIFFAVAAKKYGFSSIAVVCSALAGGLVGFLIYNIYPAKVFMGDTGSLFIGGLLSAAAVYMGLDIVFFIAGGIFVCETLSVILQVTSYKLTGKRIFKMSPIHHHFEMLGFSETKIVALFTFVTILLCVAAYFAL